MSSKKLVILDISKKIYERNLFHELNKNIITGDKVLSLTPYSSYLLCKNKNNFITFHSICSIQKFKNNVLNKYHEVKNLINMYQDFSYLLKNIMLIITHDEYYKVIKTYINEMKSKGYKIIYITDKGEDLLDFNSVIATSRASMIALNGLADNVIYFRDKNKSFYIYQSFMLKFKFILSKIQKKSFIWHTIKILVNKSTFNNFRYDNKNFVEIFDGLKTIKISKLRKEIFSSFNSLKLELCSTLKIMLDESTYSIYLKIIEDFQLTLNDINLNEIKIHPFTFLSDNKLFIESMVLKSYGKSTFMQHGHYIYESLFIHGCEVIPANINFVINDYTNRQFRRLNAKKVYTVGSINFNQPIIEKRKAYDFIYILSIINYMGHQNSIDSIDSLYSMDGNEIYNRHKGVIDFFGQVETTKKICIKVHPALINNAEYIPFWELSRRYGNVVIDLATPIHSLIEKSKYIISDYFSSEFLNREIHYKRDIILFKGAPMPLPISTLEDMTKMFILVDTVDDLKETVENIKEITKNRKRYDDIIEYYSSKECDTNKIVAEVLTKEFDGR